MEKIVDFIIIGGARCGTWAALCNLRKHPQIAMPEKEMHFFDSFLDKKKTTKWYREQFSGEMFKNKVVGEKTPAYIYFDACHSWMKNVAPDVKLILLIRNPVDRFFSQWNLQRHWFEDKGTRFTLHEMLKRDMAHMQQKAYQQTRLDSIQRGLYFEQITHLLQYFPTQQLYVAISERVKTDMKTEYNRMYQFLGVDEFDGDYEESGSEPYDGYELSNLMRRWLIKYYKPHNQMLFEWLGHDIPEWES